VGLKPAVEYGLDDNVVMGQIVHQQIAVYSVERFGHALPPTLSPLSARPDQLVDCHIPGERRAPRRLCGLLAHNTSHRHGRGPPDLPGWPDHLGDKRLKAIPSRAHVRVLREKSHGRKVRSTPLALF
jgi:hypothetical protein